MRRLRNVIVVCGCRFDAAAAQAASERSRHSWAAPTTASGGDAPTQYENAVKVTVREARPIGAAHFFAMSAQFCNPDRLKLSIARCFPQLSATALENSATRIVVTGCTHLASMCVVSQACCVAYDFRYSLL